MGDADQLADVMARRSNKPARLRRDPSRWAEGERECHPAWSGFASHTELQQLRAQVHREFDPLWRSRRRVFNNRAAAYAWLASALGIVGDAHIGELDESMCRRALEAVRSISR